MKQPSITQYTDKSIIQIQNLSNQIPASKNQEELHFLQKVSNGRSAKAVMQERAANFRIKNVQKSWKALSRFFAGGASLSCERELADQPCFP